MCCQAFSTTWLLPRNCACRSRHDRREIRHRHMAELKIRSVHSVWKAVAVPAGLRSSLGLFHASLPSRAIAQLSWKGKAGCHTQGRCVQRGETGVDILAFTHLRHRLPDLHSGLAFDLDLSKRPWWRFARRGGRTGMPYSLVVTVCVRRKS